MSLSCSATRPPWLYPLPKLEKLLRSHQYPPLQLPLLSLADSRNGCSLVDDVLSRIVGELFPPCSPQGSDGGGGDGGWGGGGGGGERSAGAAKPSCFELELAKTHLAVDLQKLFGQWCCIGLEKTLSGSPLRDLLVSDLQQQQQQMIDISNEFGTSGVLAEEGIPTCGGSGRKRGFEHQDGDGERARKVRHYADGFICPYYQRNPQDTQHKECGEKAFPNPRKLKEHIWRFTKPFICPTCGEGFGREKTKAIHCQQRKIKCKRTDKAYVYKDSAEWRRDRGVETAKSTSDMVRVFEEYDREKASGITTNHPPLNPQYDEGEAEGGEEETRSKSTSPSTSSSSSSESCISHMVDVDQKPNLHHLPAPVYPEQTPQYISTPPHSHTTSFSGSPHERPTLSFMTPHQQGGFPQQYTAFCNNSGSNNSYRRKSDANTFGGLFPDAGQTDTYSIDIEPLQRPHSAPPREHYNLNFQLPQQFHQRENHTQKQQQQQQEDGKEDDDEEAENRFQFDGPVPSILITECNQNSRPAHYMASPTAISGDSVDIAESIMPDFLGVDVDYYYGTSSSTTGSGFQTTTEVGLEEGVGGINIHQQSSSCRTEGIRICPNPLISSSSGSSSTSSSSMNYHNIANNTIDANSTFSNMGTTDPYMNHHHRRQQQQRKQEVSAQLHSPGYRSFAAGTFVMRGLGVPDVDYAPV